MSTNTIAAGISITVFGLMGLFLYFGNNSLAGLSLMTALIGPLLVYFSSALVARSEASVPAATQNDSDAPDSVSQAIESSDVVTPPLQMESPKAKNSSEDVSRVLLSWRGAGLILFAAFVIFTMYKFSHSPYSGYGLPDAVGGFIVYLVAGGIVASIVHFISRKHSALAMLVVTVFLAFMVSYHQHTSYANFSDCMLQKMVGQAENMQRYAFQECRRLFPE